MLKYYVVFAVILVVSFWLDMFFHKEDKEPTMKSALGWSAFWVSLAMAFNGWIWFSYGHKPALDFFVGYIIEKSLSIDNLFVILMIFTYFKTPSQYKHRLLFWGVLGAFIMRLIFILVGIQLIEKFDWLFYVMGAFLIFTGAKFVLEKDKEVTPDQNPAIKFLGKFFPITTKYHGKKFFIIENGKRVATPMLLCLIVIETTDLIFAVDSIPAIFAITTDPFIVMSSNFFAILGLRSLYFVLYRFFGYFRFLKFGLAAILIFIGIKLFILHWVHVPALASLGFIAAALTLSTVASVMLPEKK